MSKIKRRPFGEFGSAATRRREGAAARKWPLPPWPDPLPPLKPTCPECGGPHEKTARGHCPLLTDNELRRRAAERVELWLDQATGQTPRIEESMHRNIAEMILGWAGYFPWGMIDPEPWGGESILPAYWDHEDLGPPLRGLQKAWRLLA